MLLLRLLLLHSGAGLAGSTLLLDRSALFILILLHGGAPLALVGSQSFGIILASTSTLAGGGRGDVMRLQEALIPLSAGGVKGKSDWVAID